MILLEFTQDRFKHYDFAKRIYSMLPMFYNSVVVESHLHIALMETRYLIYDNVNREVFDIGKIDRENWLGTLTKVFENADDTIFAVDDSYKPLHVTKKALEIMTSNLNHNEVSDVTNDINVTVSEVNNAMERILKYTAEFPKIVEDAIKLKSRLVQHLVKPTDNYNDWYLSWCLEYMREDVWMNLLDMEFTGNSVRGWPRVRICEGVAPNKKILIEDYLGGVDTYTRGIAGIEYTFNPIY